MNSKILNKKLLSIIVCVIMVSTIAIALHSNNGNLETTNNKTSYIANTGNISLTGNVKNNFNGYLIATNNIPSLWGPNDVIKGIYIAYNSSDLFIGINENVSYNSLMVFFNNVTDSIYGTTNMNTLNPYTRDITFTTPMNYFSGIYFNGINTNPDGITYALSTKISESDISSTAVAINSTFVFSSINNTTEIAIPWSSMFPDGFHGDLNFGLSTFIIGSSGPWVGTGIPYAQKGIYDNGTQSSFVINNTIPVYIKNINVKPIPSYKNYPSYLLLNNFINNIEWVSTGIHDTFLGSPYDDEPLSIQTFDFNNSILPATFDIAKGQETERANLTENNTIMVKTSDSIIYILDPPYKNHVDTIQISNSSGVDQFQLNGIYSYISKSNYTYVATDPGFYIQYTNAKAYASYVSGNTIITIKTNPGTSTVSFSEKSPTSMSAKEMFNLNSLMVKNWLEKGIKPQLHGSLLAEYTLSLLLVKDDQNPITGEIVASPSPVYLYTWVRDGSFSAMSLQDAGHINSAIKYWKWMASEQGNDSLNGTWQTRFDFWNGTPSTNWINPEYDSVGLFQIGIYNLFVVTHNESLIKPFLVNIQNSINFETDSIALYGLIPEDHSIWEMQSGYWFWTQSLASIGMKDSLTLLTHISKIGHAQASGIFYNYTELTDNIVKYFYADGMFAQYITPIESQYPGNTTAVTSYLMNNTPDSSQILPIAMGFINPDSYMAKSIVNNVVSFLENHKVGGLPRYYNDLYHYTEYGGYLQSSGPSPPWIITTLSLAEYDEKTGNMSGALNLLNWASNHTQSGLLPEAIDPNFGTIIASTSPLTWSSAMFVITSLGIKENNYHYLNFY